MGETGGDGDVIDGGRGDDDDDDRKNVESMGKNEGNCDDVMMTVRIMIVTVLYG